jgi:thiamine-phosphate pyrophosphorylase
MTRDGEEARLCLVVEADAAGLARAEIALAAVSAASLVIVPADCRLDAARAKPLIALAQAMGVAALVQDDADVARSLAADGVHLAWRKDLEHAYKRARSILGPEAIVGADAGRSRHDAMMLGELGADYVAFGIPAHVDDRETAKSRRRDLVAWWAEIFVPPCIAFDVETAEEGAELAIAGADFIAVRIPALEPLGAVRTWAERLGSALGHSDRSRSRGEPCSRARS